MKGKNDSYLKIYRRIKEARNILLPLHLHPDGDSFGSSVALGLVLRGRGKNARIISADGISDNFKSFSEYSQVSWKTDISKMDLSFFDLAIFLDHAHDNRCSNDPGFSLPGSLEIMNIDHHATNTFFGNLNRVEERSSTCEILARMLFALKIPFEKIVAEMLLLGIATDTGIFRYGNSVSAFSVVKRLLSKGVSYEEVLSPILYENPLEDKILLKLALENAVYNKGKGYAYTKISYQDYRKNNLLSYESGLSLSELFRDIKGFKLSFAFTEKEPGKIGVSFRSQKGFDTSRISQGLGGGGHPQASGATLYDVSLTEAVRKTLLLVEKYI